MEGGETREGMGGEKDGRWEGGWGEGNIVRHFDLLELPPHEFNLATQQVGWQRT